MKIAKQLTSQVKVKTRFGYPWGIISFALFLTTPIYWEEGLTDDFFIGIPHYAMFNPARFVVEGPSASIWLTGSIGDNSQMITQIDAFFVAAFIGLGTWVIACLSKFIPKWQTRLSCVCAETGAKAILCWLALVWICGWLWGGGICLVNGVDRAGLINNAPESLEFALRIYRVILATVITVVIIWCVDMVVTIVRCTRTAWQFHRWGGLLLVLLAMAVPSSVLAPFFVNRTYKVIARQIVILECYINEHSNLGKNIQN
ncbi:MAG: hypothetical protein WC708_07355 [Lentisphaeria bacterium]